MHRDKNSLRLLRLPICLEGWPHGPFLPSTARPPLIRLQLRLQVELSLHILQALVDQDDRRANPQYCFPLVPAERGDAEEALEEGDVEDHEVEDHGEGDGVDELHVLPEWHGDEGFGGGEGVHGVEHFDDDEDGEGDGGGGFGAGGGEDRAGGVEKGWVGG